MSIQELHNKKLSLINWIHQLQDIEMIEQLTEFKESSITIPKWEMDEAKRRLTEIKKYPEKSIDLENVVNDIRNSL